MSSNPIIKTTPFIGGVDTRHEKPLIPVGKYSVKQNLRDRFPGFEKRKGQILHCTVADASTAINGYGFSKGSIAERHFYVQYADGSLQEATNYPPTTTTGAFGSDVLTAISGAIPASFSTYKDFCLYSDNVRQHQIATGNSVPVNGFWAYDSAAALPNILVIGRDYGTEVSDGNSSTYAVLDALTTNYSFFIMTRVPAHSFNFTTTSANGNASVLSAKYWNGALTAVSGLSDGTATAGKTLGLTGTNIVSFTAPSDELPSYFFGMSGFFYQFIISATLSATVRLSEVSYNNTGFQNVVNVWDGSLVNCIEAIIYDAKKLSYSTYSAQAVTLSKVDTDGTATVTSTQPLFSLFFDVSGSPNITKATVTGSTSINFNDSGTNADDDTITTADANFLANGFEAGQSIVITGTTSNNITVTAKSVSATIISVKPGTLTNEYNQSATLTFGENVTTINTVKTWTGAAFTTVGTFVDGTGGFVKTGHVTWNRTAVAPQKTQYNGSNVPLYCYQFTVDKRLSANITASIQGLPYYDINDLGLGRCCSAWKNRMVYTFTSFPRDIYISATDAPMVLNGADFDILTPGDGRSNPVLCMKPFYNELMVWQAEKGERGGCLTLFEGYSPTGAGQFGRVILSNKVGIMNSKCAVIIDGANNFMSTQKPLATVAIFLSRYGVFVSDGTVVALLSADIQNYFDLTKAECIRYGYEDKHWLNYDSSYNVIRIGLVSGSSVTIPNIFPVLNLTDWSWSFDTLGQPLSWAADIEAGSGQAPILQVGGGVTDGFIYQLNQTLNDVNTAIDSQCQIEINGDGNIIQLEREILRRTSGSGTITRDIYINGNTTSSNTQTFTTSTAYQYTPGDVYVLDRYVSSKLTGHNISIRWRNNTVSETMYLEDMALSIAARAVFP